jgi:WD40 repeat protein
VSIVPATIWQAAEWKGPAPLLSARFDPAGAYVYTGVQDNTVLRRDLAQRETLPLAGHRSWVRAIACSAATRQLATGDYHGRLLLWPLDEPGKPLVEIDAHDGWLRSCAVSPDGLTVATGGNDGLVKLWALPDGKPLATLDGHGCHVYTVAFRGDGLLASADLKGIIKLWNVQTEAVVREYDAKALYKYDEGFRADIGGARGLTFSRDGAWLACCGITDVTNAFAGVGKPLVIIYDAHTGERKHLLRPKADFQGTAWGVALHPEGYVIAAGGGSGGALWIWTLDKGENIHTLKLPVQARDLDLSPDGTRVVVPFADGVCRVYALTEPEYWFGHFRDLRSASAAQPNKR